MALGVSAIPCVLNASTPLLVGGGWVIWRLNADLDEIEARQLEWSLLGTLFWQHLKVTAAAAVAVLVTAIPLGVLLTRPRFRRFSGPVIAVERTLITLTSFATSFSQIYFSQVRSYRGVREVKHDSDGILHW